MNLPQPKPPVSSKRSPTLSKRCAASSNGKSTAGVSLPEPTYQLPLLANLAVSSNRGRTKVPVFPADANGHPIKAPKVKIYLRPEGYYRRPMHYIQADYSCCLYLMVVEALGGF